MIRQNENEQWPKERRFLARHSLDLLGFAMAILLILVLMYLMSVVPS